MLPSQVSLHVSLCTEYFIAFRTFHIFVVLLVLFVLVVVEKRSGFLLTCTNKAHPKAWSFISFMHFSFVIFHVCFQIGFVLALLRICAGKGMIPCWVQCMAVQMLKKPIFGLKKLSTVWTLNLLSNLHVMDNFLVSFQRSYCHVLIIDITSSDL